MNRGEIWSTATGAGFGSKPRPAVVIQSDDYARAPNLIVALIGTAHGDPRPIRPRITPNDANGLEKVSDVCVDLLVTVPREKFGKPIGQLAPDDMQRIEAALMRVLGIGEA